MLNDGEGVLVEAEGEPAALDALVRGLREEAPPLARVDAVTAEAAATRGETSFRIEASLATGRSALIPADVATCDDCLRELHDPADRRHRYPFTNCTQCGPRFTIVTGVPYDRPLTTMAGFELCADCRREYEDPRDRRFHAEPVCCPACGPRLSLEQPSDSLLLGEEALRGAVALLRGGAVVAVKGLGGYHLACDAASEPAVARLRARKLREDKPFALMTTEPERLARLEPEELDLLRSRERPVVLVRRREDAPVAPSVAPGSPWLGLMLPYTPLHHLLLEDFGGALVLTSGNRSDEPISTDDTEARERLGGIADAFLAHDRRIHRRCEDSVVRREFPVRRSRGHVPRALPLPVPARRPLVAAGAELKSTFCVARGAEAFLSPHLGDLDSELAYRAFLGDLELYLAMLGRAARGRRPRPAPRVPRDEVGARPERGARRRPAPPRARRGLPRRARGDGPRARARLRRHRLRHGRDALGRRAAALRPRRVRAGRPPRAGAAPRRRGGDPAAVADGGGAPRAGRAAGAVGALGRGAGEPGRERAALLRDGPALRRGRRAARGPRRGHLRGAGGDRAGAARGRHRGRSVRLALRGRRGARRARPRRPRRRARRAEIAAALPRDRRRRRRGGLRGGGGAARGRPLRRHLPEPASARRDDPAAGAGRVPGARPPARAAERRRDQLGQAAVAAALAGPS